MWYVPSFSFVVTILSTARYSNRIHSTWNLSLRGVAEWVGAFTRGRTMSIHIQIVTTDLYKVSCPTRGAAILPIGSETSWTSTVAKCSPHPDWCRWSLCQAIGGMPHIYAKCVTSGIQPAWTMDNELTQSLMLSHMIILYMFRSYTIEGMGTFIIRIERSRSRL